MEAGEAYVQSYARLFSEFQAGLGYIVRLSKERRRKGERLRGGVEGEREREGAPVVE